MNPAHLLPNLTLDMHDPEFWLERLENADTPLLTQSQIEEINLKIQVQFGYPDLFEIPNTLSKTEVRTRIEQYALPSNTLYGGDGQPLNAGYYEALFENTNRTLPSSVEVRFGLMTHCDVARAFPTWDVATSQPFDFGLDRFQETTVDVGWPVAVIANSQDDLWYFCLTPLYWGWIPRQYIALAERKDVLPYTQSTPFVGATASQGLIAYRRGGGVTAQMGTRLPLLEETESYFHVSLPTKADDEKLKLVDGYINKADGQFHEGYLPLTRRAILRQAFSMLNEPYAWGGSRMGIFGRDCSRFIKDVYAVTGLILPRNSGQQGTMGTHQFTFKPDMSDDERKVLITKCAQPGAILRLPGHVMLYLGEVEGEPYVIHDTWGQFRRVIVSDLSLGSESSSGSLLRRLTHIVNVESCYAG
jgi:hypothetical protein